jgi:hypothetical protein
MRPLFRIPDDAVSDVDRDRSVAVTPRIRLSIWHRQADRRRFSRPRRWTSAKQLKTGAINGNAPTCRKNSLNISIRTKSLISLRTAIPTSSHSLTAEYNI